MWPPLTMSSWLVLGLKVSSKPRLVTAFKTKCGQRIRKKKLVTVRALVNNLTGDSSTHKDRSMTQDALQVWYVRDWNLEMWREKKTSMCLSWSAEVLTNLLWPVYALPPLIAPCISVWCESSHCSERPVSPQRSHTFIITLYCRTLYGHSAPNSLPVKNRAFSSPLLLVVSVLITNTEPKPESS